MATFLPPIENPSSPMMKFVYNMSRRQFGKVMTPLKVFAARMPLAFGMFTAKIAKLDKKLELPPETQMLVRERVAHINVCEFCIDIRRAFVIKARMNEAKFDALDGYATSPLFNEAVSVDADAGLRVPSMCAQDRRMPLCPLRLRHSSGSFSSTSYQVRSPSFRHCDYARQDNWNGSKAGSLSQELYPSLPR